MYSAMIMVKSALSSHLEYRFSHVSTKSVEFCPSQVPIMVNFYRTRVSSEFIAGTRR